MKRGWLGVPTKVARCLAACLLVAACVAPPPPSPDLFRDARFGAPSQVVDADDAFALSDEMRRYLAKDLRVSFREYVGPRMLVDALNSSHPGLKLEYESTRTRNAAQAFAERRGNCLSLVLMTAAFAKAMRLDVTYQYVDMEEVWSHKEDFAFLNVHVNLTLGRRAVDATRGYDPARELTVDFLPPEQIRGQRTRPISEATVVAMYMNNRAAEALAEGRVDDAYWWARGAILHTADFAPAYNTLGVVYLRHGDLDAAETVLAHALRRDPDDKQAISNLALVLGGEGREPEARALRARLERLEPVAPYHDYLLGMQALREGDYARAREDFAREVDRAGYNSEFRFWLGIANLELGDLAEARRQITMAMASSATSADRDLYAAKLDRLRSTGVR